MTPPSLLSLLFVSSVLLLKLVCPSSGCGATTHNVIAQLVLEWYNDPEILAIFANRQPIFQNGAAFPDWGYPLDGMGGASEAAHWPPFLNATVQYIRTKYPSNPYSEEAQDLITLMYGIATHSVADQIWHDLGIVGFSHQGWIQSMADLEFFGVYPDAHSTSDTGGEFMLSHAYDLSFLDNVWYFPIFDILEIYYSINHTEVTIEKLIEGNALLFAATEAARHVEDDIFFLYAEKSAFLQEQLWSFFYGGLHDMAVWSDRCWDNLTSWLKNGPITPFCIVDPVNNPTPRSPASSPRNRMNLFFQSDFWSLFGQSFVANVEVTLDYTSRRAVFRNKEPGEAVYRRVKQALSRTTTTATATAVINTNDDERFYQKAERISKGSPRAESCGTSYGGSTFNDSLTVSTTVPHSFFGDSLVFADFNMNGKIDIAVGAPGYWTPGLPQMGAVFILLDSLTPTSGQQHMLIDPSQNQSSVLKLFGVEVGAKFGSQVVVVDLNKDGASDLVVSAPSSRSENMDYRGVVYLYYGGPHLDVERTLSSPLKPNVTFYVPGSLDPNGPSTGAYTNLGTLLKAFDIDQDGYQDLVIGSHLACDVLRNCAATQGQGPFQRGLVGVFLSSLWKQHDNVSILSADWLRYGDSSHSWFGYHVNFVSEGNLHLLLVGAPVVASNGVEEVGNLYGFLSQDIVKQNHAANPFFTISGTRTFDRFGSHTSSIANPYDPTSPIKYVVLSMPSRSTYHEIANISNWQAGAALVLKLTDIIPVTQTIDDLIPSGVYFRSINSFSRLGWSSEWGDINKDGFEDLFISEAYFNREKGRVYCFYGGEGFPLPGSVIDDMEENSDFCLEYSQSELAAHYGSNIFFVTDPILESQSYLVVTAPRDCEFASMSGSIKIYFS